MRTNPLLDAALIDAPGAWLEGSGEAARAAPFPHGRPILPRGRIGRSRPRLCGHGIWLRRLLLGGVRALSPVL